MTTALILLSLLFVITVFWLDSARARELATGLARAMCDRRGLQLLDDTVMLKRIGVRWGEGGLRFRRMFGFDFSLGDTGRRSAYLILVGTQVEQYALDLPGEEAAGSLSPRSDNPCEREEDGKVVPFRRPGRKP